MDLHLRVENRKKYTNVHLYQQTPSKGTQLLFSKVFFVGLVFFGLVWFAYLFCPRITFGYGRSQKLEHSTQMSSEFGRSCCP